jgi:hypothetical protein
VQSAKTSLTAYIKIQSHLAQRCIANNDCGLFQLFWVIKPQFVTFCFYWLRASARPQRYKRQKPGENRLKWAQVYNTRTLVTSLSWKVKKTQAGNKMFLFERHGLLASLNIGGVVPSESIRPRPGNLFEVLTIYRGRNTLKSRLMN